jgi:hypothetical protein
MAYRRHFLLKPALSLVTCLGLAWVKCLGVCSSAKTTERSPPFSSSTRRIWLFHVSMTGTMRVSS